MTTQAKIISMKFSSEKVTFGRHETFPLRYSWLTKGIQGILDNDNNPSVFNDDNAVIRFGVGRNMVSSIRYWLTACQLITPQLPSPISPLAHFIFNPQTGKDIYLEDEATIWLMHWFLATNSINATAWFWFFNKFHKPEFTSEELQTALTDFVNENVVEKKRPSASSIKKDIALLTRMYIQSTTNKRISLEEMLDSPFSLLGLVTQSDNGKIFQFKPEARANLPVGIFSFAVAEYIDKRQLTTIPIEELMYSKGDFATLGSVFKLTESDLITKLELMIDYIPNLFAIRESAGIHQLYKIDSEHKIDSMLYLQKHYNDVQTGIAA